MERIATILGAVLAQTGPSAANYTNGSPQRSRNAISATGFRFFFPCPMFAAG